MNQIKRQLDDTIDENNNNKKQKLENETIKSYFENLANETIYQIFEYLDVYHIYYAFFYFNNRLQNLILNSNFPIQIYVPLNISKTNFELYCKDMILPNRFRINYLHLSNPFTFDQLFSPPRLICQFIQLEILILEHIDTKYLSNIFRHLTTLSKLYFLKLSLADTIQEPGYLFMLIFRLPYLKSCQLTYQTKNGQQPSPIYFFEYRHSSIENLTINSPFPLNSLNNLFTCLPNLRYLSIDLLVGSHLTQINSSKIILKHLKHVSIKLDEISFFTLQQLANSYFHSVEIFYITVKNNSSYLHPQGWQELIEKSMPNLRIFDLNYVDGARENSEWFHFFIFSFNSLFWKSKKWFFNHQHYYRDKEDHGILYSTNPYRRKNFTFYWETCKDDYYLNNEIDNLNSVEYLEIYGTQATYCRNYFPNVTELKLGNYFKTSDKSISITLNHLFPLKQLKKLYISEFNFPFEEIINLLHSSPKLHTLKLDWLLVFQLNIKLLEQNQIFQSVIKINQIKYFHLDQTCTLDTFKFILKLCPQLEYLKIGMVTQQINEIFRYLFTQTNHRLRFLCFSQTPKRCLKELNILIKSENLLNNYSMKLLNRQLYLWW